MTIITDMRLIKKRFKDFGSRNLPEDKFERLDDIIARAERLEKFIKDQGDWNLYKISVPGSEND